MLVSDWAGPSCIDRAISRRRSSWADSTTRESVGGQRRHRARRPRRAPPRSSARPRRRAGRRGAVRASRWRASALRLPSRTSTWASISTARRVWRDERAVGLGQLLDRRAADPRVSSFSVAATRRCSWRPASARAWPTSMSISLSSRSSAADLVAHLRRELGCRSFPRRRWSSVGGPEAVRPQSSGIRIQPWRIAYTTAWVRSLTDSLRRIELMWFLTVCSLIDSA